VVLLRKSIPQSRNLKAAAELNVTWVKEIKTQSFDQIVKEKANVLEY
jgi:hypothetical protein